MFISIPTTQLLELQHYIALVDADMKSHYINLMFLTPGYKGHSKLYSMIVSTYSFPSKQPYFI